ncbi:MAG: PrpF domain-containing protein [Rhabdochlamydiaceae bacterium]|nr:PrpF domain-containing protein [Candidatus Amphrikana amoebophyrae]
MEFKSPCSLVRGGTSKALFFHPQDLPSDFKLREKFILSALGSPDSKQINGVGSGSVHSSKAAIISKSNQPNCDIDYDFMTVLINEPKIEYSATCGNILSAVAPFAINEGLVTPNHPITKVRIYSVNMQITVTAYVPTKENGLFNPEGTFHIDGVPSSGSKIDLEFTNCNEIFPTGNKQDSVNIDGKILQVTLVKGIAPTVIVKGKDVGIDPNCDINSLKNDSNLLQYLEKVRQTAGKLIGDEVVNYLPKISVVFPPINGGHIRGFMLSLGKQHASFAVSCSIPTTYASKVAGAVAHEVAKPADNRVILEHPSGSIEVKLAIEGEELTSATVARTAKILMKGEVYGFI